MLRYRTDDEIEEIAKRLRLRLGFERDTPIDMMAVLQKLQVSSSKFKFQRLTDFKLPDAEAQWDAAQGLMTLRESVYQGVIAEHPRARMTAAHELGHFALGHSGVRNRSLVKNAAEKFVSAVKQEESEARRFAAIFLAPAYLVGAGETVESISSRFGLSLEAAAIRQEEVAKLARQAAGQMRELPAGVVDFLRAARARGEKVTTVLPD